MVVLSLHFLLCFLFFFLAFVAGSYWRLWWQKIPTYFLNPDDRNQWILLSLSRIYMRSLFSVWFWFCFALDLLSADFTPQKRQDLFHVDTMKSLWQKLQCWPKKSDYNYLINSKILPFEVIYIYYHLFCCLFSPWGSWMIRCLRSVHNKPMLWIMNTGRKHGSVHGDEQGLHVCSLWCPRALISRAWIRPTLTLA